MEAGFWQGVMQLGAPAAILIVLIFLLYKLFDKYLTAKAESDRAVKEAEIRSQTVLAETFTQMQMTMQQHQRTAEQTQKTMEQMHETIRHISEYSNNNMKEVLHAIRVMAADQEQIMEVINDIRNRKA